MGMTLFQVFMVFLGVAFVILVHNTQRDYFETRDKDRIIWILWFLIEIILIGVLILMSFDYGTRHLLTT